MSNFLRKHKRLIWGIILVPLILAFVLFFGAGDLMSLSNRNARYAGGDTVLMQVGPLGITRAEFVAQMRTVLRQRQQMNPDVRMSDLVQDQSWSQVLQGLISNALLRLEAEKSGMSFSKAYLEEKLRDGAQFKKDDGTFDAELYNAWLDSMKGVNWRQYYGELTDDVRQQLVVRQVVSSARVLEPELRRQFNEEYTKLKVKYAAIEEKIVPTEEQIKAYYDKNPQQFMTSPERAADFVAVSIKPGIPDFMGKLLERSRAGEDFAVLAKEYASDSVIISEAPLPWLTVDDSLADHQKVLASLALNEVSEPQEAFGSYFIYKVLEERTQEGTGVREVLARQISIRPSLSPDERKAREQLANDIATKAKASGDLAAAAAEAGLTVQNTGLFSNESIDIAGLPQTDLFPFRRQVLQLAKDAISDPVPAESNIYVVKVTEIREPVQRSLEDAREDVVEAVINETKMSPEYQAKMETLTKEIATKAKSLADIQTLYPELSVEIAEAPEFTTRDFNYSQGLYWNPREVYDAVGHGEPGAFGGPIKDFLGKTYFVELVSKTPPDEATWEANKETLKEQAKMMASSARQLDYSAALLERAQTEYPIPSNQPAILATLQDLTAEDNETAPPPAAPAAGAPAPTGAEAVTTEPAPAESAAAPVATEPAPAPAESAPAESAPDAAAPAAQ